MDQRTVQEVVQNFLLIRSFSYQQYINNVNQFLAIIENRDEENIIQFYPGKDKAFFEDVLRDLGEL